MQATRKPTTSKNNIWTLFPRNHILLAFAGLFLMATGLLFSPDDTAENHTISQQLEIAVVEPTIDQSITEDPVINEPPVSKWHSIEIKIGDSLSDIFKRAKLSATDMMNILHSGAKGKELAKIFPGQTISYMQNEEGVLTGLKHHRSALETLEFTIDGSNISGTETVRTPDIYEEYKTAKIESSLFLAGQKAGLSQLQIMEVASIFSGVIDFVLDPRTGDSFSILYEQQYLDGEYIGNGEILAAQYDGADGMYTAYRYVDENGNAGYFSPEGISMRKAFLRAPLDFTRISSNFDMNRMHPIHKMIKAHRGIDYSAPRGTPVYAAGDGRVLKSGFSKPNGNYVFIQHGDQYVTKYIHLDKRSVKTGDRVKQKQVIGTVGSTGYSTGPHLHYEFLVNGEHKNPRTIVDKLPKARSIEKSEMARFTRETQPLVQQFAAFQQRFATQTAAQGTGK